MKSPPKSWLKVNPKTQNHLGYFYFFLQGTISLLGYNALLGSLDYFSSKFPQFNIYFYLPLPPMVAFNLISLIMPKIVQKVSFSSRILLSTSAMILTLILLPLSSLYLSESTLGFITIMVLSGVWGIFGQIFNNS